MTNMVDDITTNRPLAPDQDGDIGDAVQPNASTHGSISKAQHVWEMELSRFSLRMSLVNAVLALCPHFCFNLTRTNLYRLAGVRIGRATIIYGSMEMSGNKRYWERLKIGSDSQV